MVNCYSTRDWFLALMYRSKSWEIGVAGLQPIQLHPASTNATAIAVPDTASASAAFSSTSEVAVTEVQNAEKTSAEALDVAITAGCRDANSIPDNNESDDTFGSQTLTRIVPAGQTIISRLVNFANSNHTNSARKRDIENLDVTDIVHTHGDYQSSLFQILATVGLET